MGVTSSDNTTWTSCRRFWRILTAARPTPNAGCLTTSSFAQIETLKSPGVVPILAPSNRPSLPDAGVDTILIANTYHHLDDRASYLALLDQALADGGRVVVIDFVPKPREERGYGPPLEMQVSRQQVDAELAAAGFVPAEVHDFLPEQYFVEYRRR